MRRFINYDVGVDFQNTVFCSFAEVIADNELEKLYGDRDNERDSGQKNRKGKINVMRNNNLKKGKRERKAPIEEDTNQIERSTLTSMKMMRGR